jgi:hypothetical protein
VRGGHPGLYFPLFVSAPDDPKTILAVDLLGCDPNVFFGALARLWCWAVPVATEDGLLRGFSGRGLAVVARWQGSPGDFWAALQTAQWAREVPEGVVLSGWAKGAGAMMRKLRLDRERHLVDENGDERCTGRSRPRPPQGGQPKAYADNHSAEVPRKFHGKTHTRRDELKTVAPLTPRKRGARRARPRRVDPGAQPGPGLCHVCEVPVAPGLIYCRDCYVTEGGGTEEDAARLYGPPQGQDDEDRRSA